MQNWSRHSLSVAAAVGQQATDDERH